MMLLLLLLLELQSGKRKLVIDPKTHLMIRACGSMLKDLSSKIIKIKLIRIKVFDIQWGIGSFVNSACLEMKITMLRMIEFLGNGKGKRMIFTSIELDTHKVIIPQPRSQKEAQEDVTEDDLGGLVGCARKR